MRWLRDDVLFEQPPSPPVRGKGAYFRETCFLLTPGSGSTVTSFTITEPSGKVAEEDERWFGAALQIELTADHLAFPSQPGRFIHEQAELWFAVENGSIAAVKGAPHQPRQWRLEVGNPK
jgi:hypothetical protein